MARHEGRPGRPGAGAAEEVASLVPEGRRSCRCRPSSGSGLDELLGALDDVAASLPGRAGGGGLARLHVDRSFTLRGIGTVVTGTLWSGSVGAGDAVTILPRGLARGCARCRCTTSRSSARPRGSGWR